MLRQCAQNLPGATYTCNTVIQHCAQRLFSPTPFSALFIGTMIHCKTAAACTNGWTSNPLALVLVARQKHFWVHASCLYVHNYIEQLLQFSLGPWNLHSTCPQAASLAPPVEPPGKTSPQYSVVLEYSVVLQIKGFHPTAVWCGTSWRARWHHSMYIQSDGDGARSGPANQEAD